MSIRHAIRQWLVRRLQPEAPVVVATPEPEAEFTLNTNGGLPADLPVPHNCYLYVTVGEAQTFGLPLPAGTRLRFSVDPAGSEYFNFYGCDPEWQ